MSAELTADLEQTLNSYLSNRSPENIVASANSTRKIVDLVCGAVTVPKASTELLAGKDLTETPTNHSSPQEPEWIETLRSLAKSCNSLPVENIAAFYREWTRNAVSEEDLKAIREISSLDPNTIKLGIITAIYRKASSKGTRKINSFRYFFGTIREVANSKMGGSVTLQRLEHVISLLLKTRDNHQPIDGRSE